MPDAALSIRALSFTHRPATGEDAEPFTLRVGALDVAVGEQMLLTARSGGGKSTLLGLIAGLLDPDAGTVEIAGQNVHALRGAARDRFRGRHVGMVFQTFNLLTGFTALENVMAAMMFSSIPPREHAERAHELLSSLGIEKHGHLVERLSVGQQQRVAVARAVACDPVLVLADEPTASLDPENALGAMDLLEKACAAKNAALLCVSHDPAMSSRFIRRERLEELGAMEAPTP